MRQIRGLVEQNSFARRRGVSIRPFEAAAGRGCPALRGTLCRDIGPRQAIPPQQRCFCALPERIGHAAARGPIIGQREGHAFFLRKDVAAQIQIPSRRMLREHAQAPHRDRSEAALGRVPASEGNRLGQTYATSPGEASLNTTPSGRINPQRVPGPTGLPGHPTVTNGGSPLKSFSANRFCRGNVRRGGEL